MLGLGASGPGLSDLGLIGGHRTTTRIGWRGRSLPGPGLTDAGLVGDVDPGVREVAGWLAPMPGGVGPMTRAMLLTNVVEAAEAAAAA